METLSPKRLHLAIWVALICLFSPHAPAFGEENSRIVTICSHSGYGAFYRGNPRPLDSWANTIRENSRTHLDYRTYTTAAPFFDLEHTNQRRLGYFQKMKKAVQDICRQKRAGDAAFRAYVRFEGRPLVDQCNAQQRIQDAHTKAKDTYAGLVTYIDQVKERENLTRLFDEGSRVNRSGIDHLIEVLNEKKRENPSRRDLPDLTQLKAKLDTEFNYLWDKEINVRQANERDRSAKGLYADMLLQIEKEKEQARHNAAKLESQSQKIQESLARCSSAGGTDGVDRARAGTDGGEAETPGTTGDGNTPDPDGSDVNIPDEGPTPEPRPETPAPGSETPAPGPEFSDPGPETPDPGPETPDPGPGTPEPRPVPREKSFLERNKGTIAVVGVGAAAVGAAYLYKKQQDEKEKNKWRNLDDEAYAMAAVQQQQNQNNSGGGDGGDGSGDSYVGGAPPSNGTPPGSTLIVSGIPAGASVNENITEIKVSIVGPNGVLTQDTGTEVSVSCAAPVPCSITGTLTVVSSVGKATFSNIRFTGPDTGVKLRFSAPGFTPVDSTNTFNVTGTGGTRE